jgi:hypothetical protein
MRGSAAIGGGIFLAAILVVSEQVAAHADPLRPLGFLGDWEPPSLKISGYDGPTAPRRAKDDDPLRVFGRKTSG